MPPLKPAEIDQKLSVGGDAIAARSAASRMTVNVLLNDRGPYDFVVDSGADTSAVSIRIAQELQLPLGSPVVLNGMTDRNIVDRVKVGSLAFGPTKVTNLEIPALKEQDLGGDGMIGIDALVKQRLMLDFENKSIRIEDARKAEPNYGDAIVITARLRHGQLILTQVKVAGLNVQAVIDTGSEITVGNLALRDRIFRSKRSNRNWIVPTTGVTGKTIDLQLAEVRGLRIGSVGLTNLSMAFADLPPFKIFGLEDQPALLLGTDILEAFRRVSLDFANRKVRFELRRCGSTAVAISSSPTSTLARLSASGDSSVCTG